MILLDRMLIGVFWRRAGLVLCLAVFLLAFGDVLVHIKFFLGVLGTADFWRPFFYYLLRLPEMVVTVMPVMVTAAAMLVVSPMLRQGTLMVLSSAGVAPRRALVVLLWLALALGFCGAVLKDQVVPRLLPLADQQEAVMTSAGRDARRRNTSQPICWREGATVWTAEWSLPIAGEYRGVVVIADDDPRSMRRVSAERLTWQDHAWWFSDAIVLDGSAAAQRFAQVRVDDLGLRLGRDRYTLALALRPDQFKSSDELIRVYGSAALPRLVPRILTIVLPLFCLCFALPRLVRWRSRRNLVASTLYGLLWIAVPVVGVSIAANLAIATHISPVAILAVTVAVLGAASAWRWTHMRM